MTTKVFFRDTGILLTAFGLFSIGTSFYFPLSWLAGTVFFYAGLSSILYGVASIVFSLLSRWEKNSLTEKEVQELFERLGDLANANLALNAALKQERTKVEEMSSTKYPHTLN